MLMQSNLDFAWGMEYLILMLLGLYLSILLRHEHPIPPSGI